MYYLWQGLKTKMLMNVQFVHKFETLKKAEDYLYNSIGEYEKIVNERNKIFYTYYYKISNKNIKHLIIHVL